MTIETLIAVVIGKRQEITMKKNLTIAGIVILTLIIICGIAFLAFQKSMGETKNITIDDHLLVIEGGGGNSIILTSEDGSRALVVDTKMGSAAKDLAAQVTAKDVIVVNTHLHMDHTGGNRLFPDATIIAGAYTRDQWKALGKKTRYPDILIQPGQDTAITIGSETVHLRNLGGAHSWDDMVVYLEKRKFLMTGDLVFNHMHPAMLVQGGSSVRSWIATLDTLINGYEVDLVLPGHGALSDKKALLEMKDYFITISYAVGDPAKLSAAKEKFNDYHGIPMLTGFDKVVSFIEKEGTGK